MLAKGRSSNSSLATQDDYCWVQQTPAARLAESYLALERKAKLYDRLASGQHDDEDEQYNVDFVRKGTLDDEHREMGPDVSRDTASHAAIDTAAIATSKRGALLSDCRNSRVRHTISGVYV